jgi:hypothetical protein
MGLFDLFKKSGAQKQATDISINGPYKDKSANFIYQLLFCDNPELFKSSTQQPYSYPFDILFAETSTVADLQKVIDDPDTEPRLKALAYYIQRAIGYKPPKKEILAVIVEVALNEGLDVLASFSNGTARFIHHTEKIIVWENTSDSNTIRLTNDLFTKSQQIVAQIGPWDKPRRPHPVKGNTRISFLVSDGLYFGEGGINVLFNDPLAKPALDTATELMQYLTETKYSENKDCIYSCSRKSLFNNLKNK